MRAILGQGLGATETAWLTIRAAFGWVWRFATLLATKEGSGAAAVQRRYDGRIASLARDRDRLGSLAVALDHFRKVTRGYRPGLSHCYDVAKLPRTNNDLEQFFGPLRHHERRSSGRKVACPATKVRGSVRLVAAADTRLRTVEVADLVPSNLASWRELRGRLERRQAVRTPGRRFRQDPAAYLKAIEDSLINRASPS